MTQHTVDNFDFITKELVSEGGCLAYQSQN